MRIEITEFQFLYGGFDRLNHRILLKTDFLDDEPCFLPNSRR